MSRFESAIMDATDHGMDAAIARPKMSANLGLKPDGTLEISAEVLKKRLQQMGLHEELTAPKAPMSRSASPVYRVAIIRFEGGQLVVEADAEVLMAGTPDKVVLVTQENGKRSEVELKFDASISTRPEGLQPGQRVMLAFRFDPEATRDLSGPARLIWNTASGEVQCDIELPAQDESGNAPTARPEE